MISADSAFQHLLGPAAVDPLPGRFCTATRFDILRAALQPLTITTTAQIHQRGSIGVTDRPEVRRNKRRQLGKNHGCGLSRGRGAP
ncbi:hypothetical protein [Maioricimonas rarisocia]|uniref:hypothetical protein n=1 Tax=Maioricimonas rarisocia TaxID=2528026 RepID=UPI0018D233A5|nr:hypothetical protein [Maioricimonas rarisocia]